jgi:hypothetical protein
MKKRDTAFFSIGFGLGITLFEIVMLRSMSHMVVAGPTKSAALLIFLTPLSLVVWGAIVLAGNRSLNE